MSTIVLFDPNGIVPNMVVGIVYSAHTPDFDSVLNKLVNPDLSGVYTVPSIYWKVYGAALMEMSGAEKALLDAPTVKAAQRERRIFLQGRAQAVLNTLGYSTGVPSDLLLPAGADPAKFAEYREKVNTELLTKQKAVDAARNLAEVQAVDLDVSGLIAQDPGK